MEVKVLRILVIEDEKKLSGLIKRGLLEQGHAVDAVFTGEEGEALVGDIPFDLIILDIILPGKDGLEVCRSLRLKKIDVPILMLTCKNSLADKVKGLDTGADDYLVKPFDFEELYARIRALLRRERSTVNSRLTAGNIILDTVSKEVWLDGEPLEIIGKEFAILEYLMRHPNAAITRTMIEQHVWNMDLNSNPNLVEVYISRLRDKLEREGQESMIQTVRGAGYRLKIQ
jgi:DNA-binding response OmpR family regulator